LALFALVQQIFVHEMSDSNFAKLLKLLERKGLQSNNERLHIPDQWVNDAFTELQQDLDAMAAHAKCTAMLKMALRHRLEEYQTCTEENGSTDVLAENDVLVEQQWINQCVKLRILEKKTLEAYANMFS